MIYIFGACCVDKPNQTKKMLTLNYPLEYKRYFIDRKGFLPAKLVLLLSFFSRVNGWVGLRSLTDG